MDSNFRYLIQLFRKLPGVGPRQAARFILALLDRPQAELEEFGTALMELKNSVRFCQSCFNLADSHFCSICTNAKRDASKLMIVERVTDLASIERTGLYQGLYHVLGGALDPVEGVTEANLHIAELDSRIAALKKKHPSIEVIIATNPTASGEMTALYLKDLLEKVPDIRLTQLARGLASGSYLEYADEGTLKHALEQRK